MLDAVAQRYSYLPSKLLCDADSFDIMVYDVAISYEKMIRDRQEGKVDQKMFDQKELEERFNEVKNRQGNV